VIVDRPRARALERAQTAVVAGDAHEAGTRGPITLIVTHRDHGARAWYL